jgi:NADPH:quinone reductase-like Zn-dependent oxidoreductase
MKAAVYSHYGSPDVVRIGDVEMPIPAGNEVLIKVRAASVNPLDESLIKGAGRMVTGLLRPTITRLGADVAGLVEAIGSRVTQFRPGDEVFGVSIRDPQASAVGVWVCQGSFAEYVCAPESTVVRKPENVTFAQAAAAPVAGFTALQGLRDKGHIQPGQQVLINGAAGGVGTIAVQIAKSFGAAVTGVCSTRNLQMVRSIGADDVIDYVKEDFTRRAQRYDVIFDCVGNHSLSACRRVLNPSGRHILVGDRSGRRSIGLLLARVMTALVASRFARRKPLIFLARPNQADLMTLHDLMKAGKLTPVIDKCYGLSEVPEAIRHLEGRHARGKIVIAMDAPEA